MVSAPEQHGLVLAAGVEQAVGEDMAALGIGAICTSSTARNATARSSGIDSTVQTK